MMRVRLVLAAAASLALATYGSLVPFRWREAPGTAWDRVSSLPLAPLAVTWSGDLVVNVAVMLPIGFFGMAAASGGRRVRRQTGILVVAALAAFALALEVAQLFVRDRTASWSDVAGLTFGGVAGVTLWMVAGERLIERGRQIRDGSLPARLRALALLYAAGWVAIGLLPLLFPRYAYPLVRSVWLRTAAPQTAWTTAAEWALDAVSVAPIGAAIVLASLGAPLRAHAAAAMAVAVAAAVVGLDALEQVAPLVSRASPWARLLGLSLAVALNAPIAETRFGVFRM